MSHPKGFPATPARRLPGGLWAGAAPPRQPPLQRPWSHTSACPGRAGPHKVPAATSHPGALFSGREGSERLGISPGSVSIQQKRHGNNKSAGSKVLGLKCVTPASRDPGSSGPWPHAWCLLLSSRRSGLHTCSQVPVRHTVSSLRPSETCAAIGLLAVREGGFLTCTQVVTYPRRDSERSVLGLT